MIQQDNFGANQKHEAKNQIEIYTKDSRYFRLKFGSTLPESNLCLDLANKIEKLAWIDYSGQMSMA